MIFLHLPQWIKVLQLKWGTPLSSRGLTLAYSMPDQEPKERHLTATFGWLTGDCDSSQASDCGNPCNSAFPGWPAQHCIGRGSSGLSIAGGVGKVRNQFWRPCFISVFFFIFSFFLFLGGIFKIICLQIIPRLRDFHEQCSFSVVKRKLLVREGVESNPGPPSVG